jgi:ribose/xylose/arabinose/galactoside ABC-type transport system permease subunit
MAKRDIVQKRVIAFAVSGLLATLFGLLTISSLVNNSKEAKKRYDELPPLIVLKLIVL